MTAIDQDRVAPHQIKDWVYDRLRQALIDQDIAPGEPLREAALTERYGISKTPIREALVRLQRDGLVEIAAYRGARASTYTRERLLEIFETREILESECVRRAAQDESGEVARQLQATVDAAEAALAADDLDTVGHNLDEFDSILFAQLHNTLLDEIRDRLTMHLQRMGRTHLTAESARRSLGDHRAIIEAITAHDVDGALRALRAHLQSVQEQQVAALGL
ncbi:GntR family transcriptional regulator [Nocardioides mangrovi]|uniref:GntR family transcriptional regulator n=1 Tax=Nocardioides mangrovi TaxID=2874580 RepID=A0ABS7UFE3_9ACTN|nr:GntR family transcriptional regulator [Nocardioides mangrovi]MBZ5739502.1 GntR family transcriptional regulator [Nocardioides mangrovi]